MPCHCNFSPRPCQRTGQERPGGAPACTRLHAEGNPPQVSKLKNIVFLSAKQTGRLGRKQQTPHSLQFDVYTNRTAIQPNTL